MMRREAISRGSTMAGNWKAWCDVCVSGVAAYLHDLHRLAVSMHIARPLCPPGPRSEQNRLLYFPNGVHLYRHTQCSCCSLSGSGLGLAGPATPDQCIAQIPECVMLNWCNLSSEFCLSKISVPSYIYASLLMCMYCFRF